MPRVETGQILTNALAFVDDVNLHALTAPHLQHLLTILDIWSLKVDMRFAPEKC